MNEFFSLQYGGINVDVQVTEGGVYITFMEYHAGNAPALIINHTNHPISYREKGNVNERYFKFAVWIFQFKIYTCGTDLSNHPKNYSTHGPIQLAIGFCCGTTETKTLKMIYVAMESHRFSKLFKHFLS